MIERGHPALSIGAQCRLLSISRSSYYHEPVGETEQNLGLMRVIDQQFLDTPFYGVRQMTWHLQNEGHGVNQNAGFHPDRHRLALSFGTQLYDLQH